MTATMDRTLTPGQTIRLTGGGHESRLDWTVREENGALTLHGSDGRSVLDSALTEQVIRSGEWNERPSRTLVPGQVWTYGRRTYVVLEASPLEFAEFSGRSFLGFRKAEDGYLIREDAVLDAEVPPWVVDSYPMIRHAWALDRQVNRLRNESASAPTNALSPDRVRERLITVWRDEGNLDVDDLNNILGDLNLPLVEEDVEVRIEYSGHSYFTPADNDIRSGLGMASDVNVSVEDSVRIDWSYTVSTTVRGTGCVCGEVDTDDHRPGFTHEEWEAEVSCSND